MISLSKRLVNTNAITAAVLAVRPQMRFASSTSMSELKKLRDETGSPIAQVKKALDDFNGDFEKAKAFLIEKGLASAQKKLSKETREGVIGVTLTESRNFAAVGEVNCETDFVARSDLFLAFVKTLLQTVVEANKPIVFTEEQKEEVVAYLQNNTLVAEIVKDTKSDSIDKVRHMVISKLQENINLRRLTAVSVENGVIGSYVHNTLASNIGTRTCLVTLTGAASTPSAIQLADSIALQILGMRPEYLTKESVPQEVLQKEIEKIKNDFGTGLKGKPEAVVERMIEGKLKKFYEDCVLFDQPLLTDQDKEPKTIGYLVKEESKKQGQEIKIKDYILWSCK